MPKISVVIPTYNRPGLVLRAVSSALAASDRGLVGEVIVVDDASPSGPPEIADERVRVLRQEVNGGPGPARERGIQAALNPWVVLLDDDDILVAGAIDRILEKMAMHPESERFPVFQFTHGNGFLPDDYLLVSLADYLDRRIVGDFLPVINRERFVSDDYHYPESRAGGEHLLWWRIAHDVGIPSWRLEVCGLGTDAEVRLTSPQSQVRLASAHLALAQKTLAEFGPFLQRTYPAEYHRVLMAQYAYALLSGKRRVARAAVAALPAPAVKKAVLVLGLLLPLVLIKEMFLWYRKRTLPSMA